MSFFAILFQDRHGATDCKVHGSGGGEISPNRPKTAAFAFVVQIRAFIGWTCSVYRAGVFSHSLDDMEFAGRSIAEWRGNHQWAITYSISVQLFCVQ